ncbi:MAG: hypothetical protein QM401_00710 [Bacillota bacterium]|nr:hypothetical protein [Bacillota bacterium]
MAINFNPVNTDDILTVFYQRLNKDPAFRGLVNSIDKGPKRVDGFKNPSATIHVLSAPRDGETDVVRATATINIYVDDTDNGRANIAFLGQCAERIQYLMHRADLKLHPEGAIEHPRLIFGDMIAGEALILRSDIEGEHVASINVNMIIRRRRN